jgi:hypothetical protein
MEEGISDLNVIDLIQSFLYFALLPLLRDVRLSQGTREDEDPSIAETVREQVG